MLILSKIGGQTVKAYAEWLQEEFPDSHLYQWEEDGTIKKVDIGQLYSKELHRNLT